MATHRRGGKEAMNHIELLKLCHAYLRGVEINTPQGCKPVDRDTLARLINLYLNKHVQSPEVHMGQGS